MSPIEIFKKTKDEFDLVRAALTRKYNTIAVIRILFFLAALVLIVIFANFRMGMGIGLTAIIFPVIFGIIVRYHNKLASRRDLAHFTTLINQQEINRVKNNFSDLDRGEMFLDKNIPMHTIWTYLARIPFTSW